MDYRCENVHLTDDGAAVEILDQTLLPGRVEYLRLREAEALYEAIAALRVRGAPAIGIFAGYALAALFQSSPLGWLGGQGIVLGIYFASGLAPISGKYHFWWGIAAGALHACIVSYTGGFHAWLNCYNGGFTSGLVAMVLIAILEAFVPEKHTVQ